MHTTPVSLLERLRGQPADADWNRFVQLYSPLIVGWLKKHGADDAAVSDVGQEVLVAVWDKIAHFERRAGHFRGWLWTITRNKLCEHLRRTRGDVVGVVALDRHADPVDEVARYVDNEYRQFLVNRAMTLMQADFEPRTWQACWQFVAEGERAELVADRLGLTVNAVYLAKARVLRRLREELEGLIDECE